MQKDKDSIRFKKKKSWFKMKRDGLLNELDFGDEKSADVRVDCRSDAVLHDGSHLECRGFVDFLKSNSFKI